MSNGTSNRTKWTGKSLSRRQILAGTVAVAAGGIAFRPSAPFISNAAAATTTLRLLMWQPYAIKETIALFEETGDEGCAFSPKQQGGAGMSNGISKRSVWAGKSLSRRQILAGAAAVAAGGIAFRPSAPFISNAEAATTTLRLLMWQPYAIKETIALFEETVGARFSPTFFDGNSEAFNKMKVGGTRDFDLVMADGFWPRLYFKQGLTQGIDYGKLENVKNVFPEFLPDKFTLLADESGETNVAAPNCWGGYGITVNTSKIAPEDIGSINLLLNEKYKGKMSSNSRFEENIALMGILAATNLGTIGGERPDGKPFNPYHLTDAELEETKRLLIAQKKLLMTRYQDYDALDRLMRGGAIWAAPEFAETYRHLTVLRKEGKLDFDVQHVLKPKEGGLGWVDTWMISSGSNAEQVELAHRWIDLFLTKENFARVVRSTGYGGTVDVRELLKPDEIELYFQEKSADASQLHMFDQPSSPEKWERIWSDVEAS